MQGGFVHLDQGQRLRVIWAGNGFADVDVVETGNRHEVASMGFLNFHPLQALETQQLGDAAAFDAAVVLNECSLLACLDRAVVDLADHNSA